MKSPVVMLAGGSSDAVAEAIESYSQLLVEAFDGFAGTVISGGTCAGVSRVAGDLGEAHGSSITVIGYVPQVVPQGVAVDDDLRRYHEIRRTSGQDFSILEPLQAWRDVLSAGVGVNQVIVLGIGGGTISSVEYRVALALDARCGMIAGSGGAADELLGTSAAVSLPEDPEAIRDFMSRPG